MSRICLIHQQTFPNKIFTFMSKAKGRRITGYVLQARDERLSRMLASFASAEGAQPQQEGYRQSTAAMAPATAAQLDSGLAALGAASAGVLRELRQQAALAAALQVGQQCDGDWNTVV